MEKTKKQKQKQDKNKKCELTTVGKGNAKVNFQTIFANDCRITDTKVITPTNHKRNKQRDVNQSEFLAMNCNLLKACKKSDVQSLISFGFCFSYAVIMARNS